MWKIWIVKLFIASIESDSHNSEMETTPSGVVSSYGNQNYVYKLIKSMENDNNLKSGVYIFAPKKYYPMGIFKKYYDYQ